MNVMETTSTVFLKDNILNHDSCFCCELVITTTVLSCCLLTDLGCSMFDMFEMVLIIFTEIFQGIRFGA